MHKNWMVSSRLPSPRLDSLQDGCLIGASAAGSEPRGLQQTVLRGATGPQKGLCHKQA